MNSDGYDLNLAGEADDRLQRPFESELDYLTRRARQETDLAAGATNSKAAMAHRYLAAAYAVRIADIVGRQDQIELAVSEKP